MLFVLSIILLAVTTLLMVALLRLERLSDVLLSWALTAFGVLVLVFQAANLFWRINSPIFILALQSAVCLAAVGAWLKLRRPRVLPGLQIKFSLKALLAERRNWPLIFLLAGLSGALLIYLVLIYVVPPNNNDVLSIHLARVLHWKFNGSYFPWSTSHTWQLTFPVNAQLAYLWVILFTNTDHFVAVIPWLAGLSTALLVYRMAREMNFDVRTSLFAGAAWLAFPVVQLHLTSARHDLISTWLFVSCIYFLQQWVKTQKWQMMLLSAAALGLVVGTNFSIAAYLPGLAALLLIWLIARQITFKKLLAWVGCSALAFALLSSPIYISNWRYFGSPLGPDTAQMTSQAIAPEVSLGRYVGINVTRWSYQFIDFSGLPAPLARLGTQAKARTAQAVSSVLKMNLEGDVATMNQHVFAWDTLYQLQEDEAWYGLIGWGLVFPTGLVAAWMGLKKRRVLFAVPFIFLLTAMITCTLIRPGWTPYDGRYFLPLAAFSAALLPLWFGGKKSAVVIQWAVAVLAVCGVLMVVLFNPGKQVAGGAAVWKMNRTDRMTRQYYTSKEMLYLLEAVVPQDGVVAYATNGIDVPEYGLWGEHFTRQVIEVNPPDNVSSADWLSQRGVEYLLILVSPGYPGPIAPGCEYTDSLGDWLIYTCAFQN